MKYITSNIEDIGYYMCPGFVSVSSKVHCAFVSQNMHVHMSKGELERERERQMIERPEHFRHETNEMAGCISWFPAVIKAEERNALQLISTARGSSPLIPVNM